MKQIPQLNLVAPSLYRRRHGSPLPPPLLFASPSPWATSALAEHFFGFLSVSSSFPAGPSAGLLQLPQPSRRRHEALPPRRRCRSHQPRPRTSSGLPRPPSTSPDHRLASRPWCPLAPARRTRAAAVGPTGLSIKFAWPSSRREVKMIILLATSFYLLSDMKDQQDECLIR